jgi:RNA polymerase sigma-70 factor (ECF subfamily)
MAWDADSQRRAFEDEALPQLDTVYRVALRLSGDATRADDLTQETMLKAFRAWHQYKPGSNIRAWLLTILRHTFINQYRREKIRGTSVDVDDLERYTIFDAGQETDPEGRFFDQIVDDQVLAAIAAVADDFREVLILSDIEGLSYAEIAEVTGVPIGTVKSRLFRARRALQDALRDYAVEMGYIKRTAP